MIQTKTNRGTVFILDDDVTLRIAYARILQDAGYACHALGTFGDLQTTLMDHDQAPKNACLLLDMKMPAINGLAVQRWLLEQRIQLPIVFASGQSEMKDAIAAMRSGAIDFLLKPIGEDQLIAAIDSALNSASDRLSAPLPERFKSLTPRESEVLRLVVKGKRSQDIADTLLITLRTVKMHRSNIMAKVGVENVAQLVALYHQQLS